MGALADAVDYFFAEIIRIPVRKALDPNDPADFNKIVASLTAATKGLTQAAEAKALKEALKILDVDWKGMSGAAKDKIVVAAKQSLNPSKLLLPKIEQHFEANAAAIGMATKSSAVKQFGFGVSVDLDKQEQQTLWHIALSQGNYVRDEYGKRSDLFAMKAKEIVANALEQGLGRKDIAQELKQQLAAQQFNRSEAYWSVISGAFVNRARTYTNLATYEGAGVEEFEFDAVLDERTSTVCRFMHGKRFSVASAKGAYQAGDSGEEPEDVKIAQPWLSIGSNDEGKQHIYYKTPAGNKKIVAHVESSGMGKVDETGSYSGAMSNKSLVRAGVMTPPLHGNCRSTINPVLDTGGVVTSAPGSYAPVEQVPEEVAPPPPPAFALQPYEPPAEKPLATTQEQPAKPSTGQFGFKFPPGVGIGNAQIVDLTPAEPTAPPIKAYISPATKKKEALDKLEALSNIADGHPDITPGNVWADFAALKPKPAAELAAKQSVIDAALSANAPVKPKWTSGMKAISNLQVSSNEVDYEKVKAYLQNPKLLKDATIKVVETTGEKVGGFWKKNHVVVENKEALFAHQLLGKDKVNFQQINLKTYEKELGTAAKSAMSKPAAPPPPPPPAPPKPVVSPPPTGYGKPIVPEDILAKKIGAQGGSNEGGMYEATDGTKRYVKWYANKSYTGDRTDGEAQAHGEVIANNLYRALGHEAPEGVVWQGKNAAGKDAHVYAAKLLDGAVMGMSPTKDQAKEFMKGFAADVLMGNWDAIGASGDNAFILKNGKIARIDNGGALLMRAKGGRKPPEVLDTITEWDLLFDPQKNPSYHKIAKIAGYTKADDFKGEVKRQVDEIVAKRAAFGGWKNFVDQSSPGLNETDKAAIAKMLEARTNLMQGKVAAMFAPPPPPAKVLGTQPESLARNAPRAGLSVSDLARAPGPNGLKGNGDFDGGFAVRDKAYKEIFAQMQASAGVKIEEKKDVYALSKARMAEIPRESKQGIIAFSGMDYTAIRDSEISGRPNANAQKIAKAFSEGKPLPCTSYRAITVPEAAVNAMIQNDGVFRLGQGNTTATASSSWDPKVGLNWKGQLSTFSQTGSTWKVVFQIRGQSGLPIQDISKFDYEHEILMHASAEFKVVGASRLEGHDRVVFVELEETTSADDVRARAGGGAAAPKRTRRKKPT